MTVQFVDQTLRDGQQSWWGMRMRLGMALYKARSPEERREMDREATDAFFGSVSEEEIENAKRLVAAGRSGIRRSIMAQ